jgi:hypothetical protein
VGVVGWVLFCTWRAVCSNLSDAGQSGGQLDWMRYKGRKGRTPHKVMIFLPIVICHIVEPCIVQPDISLCFISDQFYFCCRFNNLRKISLCIEKKNGKENTPP